MRWKGKRAAPLTTTATRSSLLPIPTAGHHGGLLRWFYPPTPTGEVGGGGAFMHPIHRLSIPQTLASYFLSSSLSSLPAPHVGVTLQSLCVLSRGSVSRKCRCDRVGNEMSLRCRRANGRKMPSSCLFAPKLAAIYRHEQSMLVLPPSSSSSSHIPKPRSPSRPLIIHPKPQLVCPTLYCDITVGTLL